MEACPGAADPRFVGDPVDTLTGSVIDRMLDFRLTGPIELRWYRHYDSSQSTQQLALGRGWTHEFDRTLFADHNGMTYQEPIGRRTPFPRLWTDGEECVRGGLTLQRVSLRTYVLRRHAEPAMEFEFRAPHSRARLTRLFDGGHEVIFQHDAALALRRIVDSAGRRIAVDEADGGRLVRLALEATPTDAEMLLVAYRYDERGNLVATQNAAGHGYTFTYDDANRLVRRRGRKGFQFYFSYDTQGRCTVAVGDDRLYGVALNYQIPGRLTKVTRPDRGVWAYTFTPAGQLAQICDPLGGTQKFIHDAMGRTILELDPNGNATRLVHDPAGATVARIDSLGYSVALPEDPNAPNPLSYRLAASPAEYENGRLLDVEGIRLPSAKQALTLPLARQTQGLLVMRQPPASQAAQEPPFQVRPLGALWWPAPTQGRVFNNLGKLVEQHDDLGRRREWTYDASGNLARYTDFDGATWRYDHGAWHYLRQVDSPIGATVRLSYTPAGEVESFLDAGGTLSEYRYDLRDRLIEVRRHGAVRETYTRDAAGNLTAKHAADGRLLLRIEIGPGNLPVRRVLASGEEHDFVHDGAGLCLSAATRKDVVLFAYDKFGNRSSEKRNGEGVEHSFDGLNALGRSVYFGRFTVRHRRRMDGSLILTDPGGQEHRIRRLPCGIVERYLGNGSQETAQYDNRGRCLFKSLEGLGATPWNRRYHWSGEDELRQVQDSLHGDVRHEYDAAHRLRRRHIGGTVEDYVFDLADNLVAQPGLVNVRLQSGNLLAEANGERFKFNDRHHVASREGPAGISAYHYDSRDQLVRIETPGGLWEAEYDALGRRTRKHWQGQTTEFFWNADQLVAEVGPHGSLRLYVYADTLAQTPFLILDYDSRRADPATCRRYFVFTDQLGAPSRIEDEQRAVVWSARMAPFGWAQVSPAAGIVCNLRAPGQYVDPETGLHYNRYRYCDPVLGRYLQSDPWGITGGHNLHAYLPNPLARCDLRGLGDESGKKRKGDDDDCEENKPLHERKGWVDEFGEQKKVTGDGSVDRDHQPSKAAIKQAALDEINRRVEAGEIKRPSAEQREEINKRIDKESQAVVVDKEVHKAGPTHGHKNDTARISEDAQDLGKAANRDADAMVNNAKDLDPDNVPKYEQAAQEIKQQTHESIMNNVNSIIDDVLGL